MRVIYSFLLILASNSVSARENSVANDVGGDYAQVKELLGQFYRRSARRLGHDYNPATLIRIPDEDVNFDDGTEATANRKIWQEVFENDIILTLPQAERLLKENNGREKRQAQPDLSSFWPNLTISYEFAYTDPAWQNLIRSALRHISQNTCMRFRENGNDRDSLKYFRGSGCWSNVGKVGGKQQVSIGYGCDALGIVAHETLHALGLWHEQSRDDRDRYVNIINERIIRGTSGNFEKRNSLNSDNQGQPYDLGSVMHYGSKAFSNDFNLRTIETKDSRMQGTIGQREGISFKDAKMINIRYCQGVCGTKLPCQNEGYTDPNNCGKCKCPRGYGGVYCQNVEPTSCGDELLATPDFQTLTSGEVYSNMNCVWRIRAPAGQRVEVILDEANFPCIDPCTSYVEVKWAQSRTQTGARYCCPARATFASDQDDIVVFIRGSSSLQPGYQGFSLRYRSFGYLVVPPPIPTTTTRRPTTTRATTRYTRYTRYTRPYTQYPVYTRRYTRYTTRYPYVRPYGGFGFGFPWDSRSNDSTQQSPAESSAVDTAVAIPATRLKTKQQEKAADTVSTYAADSTQVITTTQPPPTTQPISSSNWGLWGEWSYCSASCGGCGVRKRVRGCYGGNRDCDGKNEEVQPCNQQVCPGNAKSMMCQGRLLLPCDLVDRLNYGAPASDQVSIVANPVVRRRPTSSFYRKPYPTQNRYRGYRPRDSYRYNNRLTARIKRSLQYGICEKRFTYSCPTALLTVQMDWKQGQSDAPSASPQCCANYTARDGLCYKL